MAAGDLNGDLRDAYLTPEQRAAKLAGRGATGPVGRATQQLAAQPAATLADAAPGLVSSVAASAPSNNLQPSGVPPSAPVQAPVSSTAPLTLASAAPGAQPRAQDITAGQYRMLSASSGTPESPIAARIGANGVPEFTNQPADLRNAFAANPVSTENNQSKATATLADALPAAARMSPANPGFQGSGSLGNIGDGIGTFSQASAGDGQLAMSRYARAADIRDAGKSRDRLDLANAKLTRDGNFTVVSDSGRRPTLSDIRFGQQRQIDTQAMQEAAKVAQTQIDNRRQGQAADLQLSQASRLDDIMRAASSPNATPEDRAAYAKAVDPTGEKALARQLTEANIGKVSAEGRAADAKSQSLSTGLDGQLKQLEIEKRRTDADTAVQAVTAQKVGALDIAKDAQKLVSEISGAGNLDNITGTISSKTPTIRDASQDLINKANRLQTLLTADNLKLMSGVLTDKDIAFLSQIGAGLGIGENGINGSIEGTKQRLGEISTRLGEKISAYEKTLPAPSKSSASTVTAATPTSALVRVSSPADVERLPSGSLFIAPDGSTRRKP